MAMATTQAAAASGMSQRSEHLSTVVGQQHGFFRRQGRARGLSLGMPADQHATADERSAAVDDRATQVRQGFAVHRGGTLYVAGFMYTTRTALHIGCSLNGEN
ncbi:MAG: hypothetical protein JO345_18055 [Streptosporangiaceae bacterium]|nr:hypothetical protein [Streptosporangiaceae bacterium]